MYCYISKFRFRPSNLTVLTTVAVTGGPSSKMPPPAGSTLKKSAFEPQQRSTAFQQESTVDYTRQVLELAHTSRLSFLYCIAPPTQKSISRVITMLQQQPAEHSSSLDLEADGYKTGASRPDSLSKVPLGEYSDVDDTRLGTESTARKYWTTFTKGVSLEGHGVQPLTEEERSDAKFIQNFTLW